MAAKKSRGGAKEAIISGITLVVLIGAILGWARVNNINSFQSARGYFQSWADSINECGYINWITGKCYTPPSSNGGGSGGGITWTPPSSGTGSSNGNSGGSTPSGGSNTNGGSKGDFQELLKGIPVAESDSNAPYDRGEWKHWIGSPCNTRQEVLKQQGQNVVLDEAKACKVISGIWIDPYSGDEFTDPSKLDIDHVIPLSWANRNGGATWTSEQKQAFANDFDHLLATSAKENRGKGDKGPGDYMPPNKAYHCTYSQIWVFTLDKYDLSIPEKDFKALSKGLSTCK